MNGMKAISETSSHYTDSFLKNVGLKPKTDELPASNTTDEVSETATTDDLTAKDVTEAERLAAERVSEELHVAIELKTFDAERVDYADSITPASSRPPTFRGNEPGWKEGMTTLQVQQQHPIGAGVFLDSSPPTSFVNQAFSRSQSNKNDEIEQQL